MKTHFILFAVALLLLSPFNLSVTAQDTFDNVNDDVDDSYDSNPIMNSIEPIQLLATGKEAAEGMAAMASDNQAASSANPMPPSLYSNSPPGAPSEFECVEDEVAGTAASVPAPTGVYELPPGGVSGGSCAPALTIHDTLVVTSTKVVSTTCTLTTTKNVPVVTTVTQEVIKKVFKTVTETMIQTKVVEKMVTETKAVTLTVNTCSISVTGVLSASTQVYQTYTPPMAEVSECIEFETQVAYNTYPPNYGGYGAGSVASAPTMTIDVSPAMSGGGYNTPPMTTSAMPAPMSTKGYAAQGYAGGYGY